MGRRFWTNEERIFRATAGDPRARKELKVRALAAELGEIVGDLRRLDDFELENLHGRLLEELHGL